jgi:hypothetical protein
MKAPYGWIWTRGGYRRLTPKAFNRRLRRQHNRRLAKRSRPQGAAEVVDNDTTTPTDKGGNHE